MWPFGRRRALAELLAEMLAANEALATEHNRTRDRLEELMRFTEEAVGQRCPAHWGPPILSASVPPENEPREVPARFAVPPAPPGT